ncbi:MAG: ABC transporter permease, partial [Pseudomonadales bacterium]|nr:ABC transporter permease [Pseudomonadales bacterium]
GDELVVEFLQGERLTTTIAVNGIIEENLGLSVFMSKAALWQASGEPTVVDGAFLSIDESARDSINSKLKGYPAVTGVASPSSMYESFQEQLADGILISSGFLLGFAGVIAVGVIYNAARISLSERGRELASLRVMGFHRSEVATLLLGEQGIITVFAIPLGWAIGYSLCYAVTIGMQTDIYRLPFVTDTKTFLMSGAYIIFQPLLAAGLSKKGWTKSIWSKSLKQGSRP